MPYDIMNAMNPRVIVMFMLLAVQAFYTRGDATVDLYAGWRWMPFGYYYDDFYWYRGGYPLRRADPFPFNGYTGYVPACWYFDHYVRVRLNNAREFPSVADPLLPPFAGSAPLGLRDPQREALWADDINALLGSLTNAPPADSIP